MSTKSSRDELDEAFRRAAREQVGRLERRLMIWRGALAIGDRATTAAAQSRMGR